MFIDDFALTASALFLGAAIYVALCEQPARLALDDRALLAEFKPSYLHGALLQASLSVVAGVLGALAWRRTDVWAWLVGAISIVAAWPYTLLFIRRTNNELLATDLDHAGPRTRTLIVRWGHLHLGRVALGAISTALFLWASTR